MNDETLLESTYRLLDATDLTYRQVASGAAVDMNWLAKFKQRAINEPGVGKVQRVHDFLAAYEAIRVPPPSGTPTPRHAA
jgi:hypothetical protein